MEHPIDTQLEYRQYEPMRQDFPSRIVAAARMTPQRRSVRLGEWLGALFQDFRLLPQPAYALAGMLFMGMLLGYMNPMQESVEGTPQNLVEIFEDDGAVI